MFEVIIKLLRDKDTDQTGTIDGEGGSHRGNNKRPNRDKNQQF